MRRSPSQRNFLLGLMWLTGVLIGCGGADLPGDTAYLTGKVTKADGTPVPTGCALILIHRETGIVALGLTDASGEFQARMRDQPRILQGEYAVNVTPAGEPDEDSGKLPPAWSEVPKKYWSPETSGETVTIGPGNNRYELVLEE